MKKKLIALGLTGLMVLASMPFAAFANNVEHNDVITETSFEHNNRSNFISFPFTRLEPGQKITNPNTIHIDPATSTYLYFDFQWRNDEGDFSHVPMIVRFVNVDDSSIYFDYIMTGGYYHSYTIINPNTPKGDYEVILFNSELNPESITIDGFLFV